MNVTMRASKTNEKESSFCSKLICLYDWSLKPTLCLRQRFRRIDIARTQGYKSINKGYTIKEKSLPFFSWISSGFKQIFHRRIFSHDATLFFYRSLIPNDGS